MIVYKKIVNFKKYKEQEFYRRMNAKLRGEKYTPRPIISFTYTYKIKQEKVNVT